MLTEVNIGSQLLYLIVLLLFLSLLILIKIADYLKNSNINIINTTEERIDKDIKKSTNNKSNNNCDSNDIKIEDLDSKWAKTKTVETNMDGLGDKKVVDGSASLDAVKLMRDLKNKNKSE